MSLRTFSLSMSIVCVCFTASLSAQVGAQAGGFSRLGFGARGMGMGNALSAVPNGSIAGYYNPALIPFQKSTSLYGSYSFLALDRTLNQVALTQQFRLTRRGAKRFDEDPDAQSIAGASLSWINAGDAEVQGYDSDGFETEKLSVYENQFALGFGNRFSRKFSIGMNFKFYYSGLYRDISTSGFGVDVGALYFVTEDLTVAVVAQELLTKYKWDTSTLYGSERGKSTEDPFVRIVRGAVAWRLPERNGTVAAEIESWGGDAILARFGAEVALVPAFVLRAGVERVDLGGDHIEPRPTFGFTVIPPVAGMTPVVHYAVILEPVAPTSTHVLSIGLVF